jgi:hypothetical protein
MSTGPMRRSGAERLLQNISRATFVKLLQDAHIYDIVEITRQDDIPKLYEILRFLPDDPQVTYIMPILMTRD